MHNYEVSNLQIVNSTDSNIKVEMGTILGKINIGFAHIFIIHALHKHESDLDCVFQLTRKTQQNIDMIGLSSTLSSMMDAIYIKSRNTRLQTKGEKEYKLNSLLQRARVH